MSPVPFMTVCVGHQVYLYDFPVTLFFGTTLFLWINQSVHSPEGQHPPFWEAFRKLPIFLCLLKGNSLVLLKTNFAKKPKNPV